MTPAKEMAELLIFFGEKFTHGRWPKEFAEIAAAILAMEAALTAAIALLRAVDKVYPAQIDGLTRQIDALERRGDGH